MPPPHKMEANEPDANAPGTADIQLTIHDHAKAGNVSEIDRLLKEGIGTTTTASSSSIIEAPYGLFCLTPLHLASLTGQIEVVRLLIDRGANVNSGTTDKSTPLHQAAHCGYTDIAELLIDHGADVNGSEEGSWTPMRSPLHMAVFSGHVETTRLLLKRGANTETRQGNRWTALHVALHQGHVDVAAVLLEHGADMNALDANQTAPIHTAVSKDLCNFVRLFLQHGCNIEARSPSFQTPLHLAASRYPAEPELRESETAMSNLLIGYGADIGSRDSKGRTPLHLASFVDQQFVHARTKDGRTASHEVPVDSHDCYVELLRNGAEVNAVDEDEWTPLLWNDEGGVVELLLMPWWRRSFVV